MEKACIAMKKVGYLCTAILLLAISLLLTSCSKTIAYSTSNPTQLTGERSGQSYTLAQSPAPVYRHLRAKPQTLTQAQLEKVRDALAVGEGDAFTYYEDPYSKEASLTFTRGAAHAPVASIGINEREVLQWADEFLQETGIFPTGEYIAEVQAGDVCRVTYHPAFKGVPVIQAGKIQLTYDKQGVKNLYYAWNAITGGGRAYTEQEVCTVQEAVNKFERSLPFQNLQEGAAQGGCVRQVYICNRKQVEGGMKRYFTGEAIHDEVVICPGWAFSSNSDHPLENVYQTVKAIPDE